MKRKLKLHDISNFQTTNDGVDEIRYHYQNNDFRDINVFN